MFWLIKQVRRLMGYDRYSSETIDRLAYSMHVNDLRWVARAAMYSVVFLIIITIAAYKVVGGLGPFQITAIAGGLVGGLGAIIAWCYQTGSARLGFVDLFACEVATLCRICTINGLADTCIGAYEVDAGHPRHTPKEIKAIRERFTHFDSEEAYTPVFDANAKELRSLKVQVVTNITAFYTYWKATRDAFRKLAKTPEVGNDVPSNSDDDPWHRAMRNVVYMQFLTCESARKAIRDLIEFEPNKAENTITILLSELPSYRFLLTHFPKHDVRRVRLELRRKRYRTVVKEVRDQVQKASSVKVSQQMSEELRRDWDKAHQMLPELRKQYKSAMRKQVPASPAAARRPPITTGAAADGNGRSGDVNAHRVASARKRTVPLAVQ